MRLEGVQRFERALYSLAEVGRKSVADEARTNIKGMINVAYSITPPLGSKGGSADSSGRPRWSAGREAGRNAIRKDLSNAFVITKGKRSKENLIAWYLSVRDPRTKRIKGTQLRSAEGKFAGAQYIKKNATKGDVDAVRKFLFARQGTVASGWSKAARFLGINPPGWVAAWSNKNSQFFFRNDLFSLQVSATNITSHQDADKIQGKLDRAFEIQTGKMERRLAAILAKKAKEI